MGLKDTDSSKWTEPYCCSVFSFLSFMQDFEWERYELQQGQKIKIISTFDTTYSHPSLSKRVASGDISLVRHTDKKDNEVELKISEVKQADAGFYICQTPSTDSEIEGNYEAEVQLIGKTGLRVLYQWVPILQVNEYFNGCP